MAPWVKRKTWCLIHVTLNLFKIDYIRLSCLRQFLMQAILHLFFSPAIILTSLMFSKKGGIISLLFRERGRCYWSKQINVVLVFPKALTYFSQDYFFYSKTGFINWNLLIIFHIFLFKKNILMVKFKLLSERCQVNRCIFFISIYKQLTIFCNINFSIRFPKKLFNSLVLVPKLAVLDDWFLSRLTGCNSFIQ